MFWIALGGDAYGEAVRVRRSPQEPSFLPNYGKRHGNGIRDLLVKGGSMFRNMAIALTCATGLGLFIAIAILSADTSDSGAPQAPVYSPYPAGLIPKDLKAETDRVNREIEDLEQEAMSQLQHFPNERSTSVLNHYF
jgi:hypothetical protein